MSGHLDPDRYVPTVEAYICPLHRKNLLGAYPGCTCSSSSGLRKATDSEYLRRRRQRLIERREELLEELRIIESQLFSE